MPYTRLTPLWVQTVPFYITPSKTEKVFQSFPGDSFRRIDSTFGSWRCLSSLYLFRVYVTGKPPSFLSWTPWSYVSQPPVIFTAGFSPRLRTSRPTSRSPNKIRKVKRGSSLSSDDFPKFLLSTTLNVRPFFINNIDVLPRLNLRPTLS